jgi:hypothetical protein
MAWYGRVKPVSKSENIVVDFSSVFTIDIDLLKKMAKEAIELYIESLKAHGEEIPTEEETLEYTLTITAYA